MESETLCIYSIGQGRISSAKKSIRLSEKQKEELIYILTSECNGNWIASIVDKSNIKAATGYETAVQTWIDTYEENNKIQYDKN